jgi:hypothetical protein
MINALVGAIGGALVVILFQHVLRNQEHKKVRSALLREIERNASELNEFWEKANQEPSEIDKFTQFVVVIDDSGWDEKYRVIDAPLPRWSFKIWDTYIATAALALNAEKFNNSYQIYEDLPRINEIYSELKKVPYSDEQRSIRLWNELSRLVEKTRDMLESLRGI